MPARMNFVRTGLITNIEIKNKSLASLSLGEGTRVRPLITRYVITEIRIATKGTAG